MYFENFYFFSEDDDDDDGLVFYIPFSYTEVMGE